MMIPEDPRELDTQCPCGNRGEIKPHIPAARIGSDSAWLCWDCFDRWKESERDAALEALEEDTRPNLEAECEAEDMQRYE